jgi:hypothetical protein
VLSLLVVLFAMLVELDDACWDPESSLVLFCAGVASVVLFPEVWSSVLLVVEVLLVLSDGVVVFVLPSSPPVVGFLLSSSVVFFFGTSGVSVSFLLGTVDYLSLSVLSLAIFYMSGVLSTTTMLKAMIIIMVKIMNLYPRTGFFLVMISVSNISTAPMCEVLQLDILELRLSRSSSLVD